MQKDALLKIQIWLQIHKMHERSTVVIQNVVSLLSIHQIHFQWK